jgi:hypothetical protein
LGWTSLRYNDITHWGQSGSHFLCLRSCGIIKNQSQYNQIIT